MSYGYDESGAPGNQRGTRSERIKRGLEDYVDVPERVAEFRELYPQGRIRPQNPDQPIEIIRLKAWYEVPVEGGFEGETRLEEREETYLQYIACAYRDANDELPGIGIAWEIFPGRTTYTRRSEAMNAETSAWGRAIVAALAADSKRGIATRSEVQNRQAEREQQPQGQRQGPPPQQGTPPNLEQLDPMINMLFAASNKQEMATAWNTAAHNWLLDTQIPGRDAGFLYRHLWKERMTQLNAEAEAREKAAGLGEETGEPQVAPEVTGDGTDEAVTAVQEGLEGQVVEDTNTPPEGVTVEESVAHVKSTEPDPRDA